MHEPLEGRALPELSAGAPAREEKGVKAGELREILEAVPNDWPVVMARFARSVSAQPLDRTSTEMVEVDGVDLDLIDEDGAGDDVLTALVLWPK